MAEDVELTYDEIMSLSELDLEEMGTTREELLMLSSQYEEEGYSSEEPIELDITIDEESLKELEEQESVDTSIDDLPWLDELLMNDSCVLFEKDEEDDSTGSSDIAQNENQPKRTNLSKKMQKKKEEREKEKIKVIERMPDFHSPDQFWPEYEAIIRKRFTCTGRKVTAIENIVQPELLKKFKGAIKKEKQKGKNTGSRLFLAFHGTNPGNIESIKKSGLLVPGKNNNLPVVNGAAYGVGIYLTTHDPSISISYCSGGTQMFCCAVLLSDVVKTKNMGNVLVIQEESYVLPSFLVTFAPHTAPVSSIIVKESEKEEKKVNKTKKGEVILTKKEREERRKKNKEKKQ